MHQTGKTRRIQGVLHQTRETRRIQGVYLTCERIPDESDQFRTRKVEVHYDGTAEITIDLRKVDHLILRAVKNKSKVARQGAITVKVRVRTETRPLEDNK